MRIAIPYLFFIIFILISCRETPKKEILMVKSMLSPAGAGSKFPFLYSGSDKTIMSWIESKSDSVILLKYSEFNGNSWGEAKEIVQGADWFVNWADFPAIVEHNGHVLSHILQKSSPETFSYDIKLNVLPNGGSDWQTKLPLHTDNTKTEHGFVTLLPYKENSFFATWLDGRNTENGGEHEHHGSMTLRAAEVTATGDILEEAELDARTCDCCQTTAAITKNGPVVLYRDRSEEEIRDISVVRYINGKWTAPQTIHNDNWQIRGCPVNGPKAAALDNTLAVAWFTAAGEIPKVNVIFSTDGGEYFDSGITLSENQTLGRVDIALLDHNTALVSYMETSEGTTRLMAVKVNRSRVISKPIIVSEMDATRSSGFPQMELVNNKLLFAWTDVSGAESEIKMVYVLVNEF